LKKLRASYWKIPFGAFGATGAAAAAGATGAGDGAGDLSSLMTCSDQKNFISTDPAQPRRAKKDKY
jgi:hypothetical protein